jgi:hypothetical protein
VKSISLKVTIWSVAALAISLAVFLLIGANVIGKSTTENFTHANQQLFRYALTVYHADGKEGLARYMQELNQPGETHYSICNASGHDLESGEDHSELIKVSVGKERPYRRGELHLACDFHRAIHYPVYPILCSAASNGRSVVLAGYDVHHAPGSTTCRCGGPVWSRGADSTRDAAVKRRNRQSGQIVQRDGRTH